MVHNLIKPSDPEENIWETKKPWEKQVIDDFKCRHSQKKKRETSKAVPAIHFRENEL
jgi:hypothetical protein